MPETTEITTLSDLKPDSRNGNRGTKRGRKAVAESIAKLGAGRSILLDREGRIIAGNKTAEAAQAVGLSDVIVVPSDGTKLIAVQRTDLDLEKDPKARELALADNRAGQLGLDWDADVLKDLAVELDLQPYFTSSELCKLGVDISSESAADVPEAAIDRAQAVQDIWKVQPGQLWEIGPHRLLCGDSTNPEDVRRLMAGERAALMATDPPYLVEYKGGNHPRSLSNSELVKDKHHADYKEQEDPEFFTRFLRVALDEALTENPAIYQWHAHKRQALVEQAWTECGLLIHQQIIWVKARAVLTHSHYMWAHEPSFYGWVEGKQPSLKPPSNATTVWQIDQKNLEGIHPTEKPIEIFSRPIEYHLPKNGICYEPFSGSGSCLAAAEVTGRRCFAIEIAPAFVAVALQRLADMSLEPKLL